MTAKQYINRFLIVLEKLQITNMQGKIIDFEQATEELINLFGSLKQSGRKSIFIGNGGSAAIASHMAVDYWKNGGVPALCFNDGAQLTCISNDDGYESVFARPLQFFARPEDILVAISSSGQSANILRAAEAAAGIGCRIITLSGFLPGNPLRGKGFFNVYCPSQDYGLVELAHQMFLHMILDLIPAGD